MFITFEGPEGSGKSTQIGLLADYLTSQGYDCVRTREPGGTAIGDQIRACLHHVGNDDMTAEAEILLYSASRAQLVQTVILPALSAQKIILCDRFADSTIAYQGYGRGLDLAVLQQITHFATTGVQPDLTILLDLPVEKGLARRQENGEVMNRLDLESLAFHRRVRAGYHTLCRQQPDRWVVVDADRSKEAVQATLRQLIMARLPQLVAL